MGIVRAARLRLRPAPVVPPQLYLSSVLLSVRGHGRLYSTPVNDEAARKRSLSGKSLALVLSQAESHSSG